MKPTTCDTAYFGAIEIIMCTGRVPANDREGVVHRVAAGDQGDENRSPEQRDPEKLAHAAERGEDYAPPLR